MLGVAALLGVAAGAQSTVEVNKLLASPSVQVDVDLATTSTWDHYAERMVGTSHIAMNARADWREHLTMVAKVRQLDATTPSACIFGCSPPQQPQMPPRVPARSGWKRISVPSMSADMECSTTTCMSATPAV